MSQASTYHKMGYTCAEAMIKAYNEKNNQNIPVSLGSGMGVGLTVGSVCGATNAAALIIGYLKGRESETQTNEARAYTRELMEKIKGKYGTELCKELKKNGISCQEIIDYNFEELNNILSK